MVPHWDAVVAGHICLDVIPCFAHGEDTALTELLRPGHLVEVGPATLSTGGAVSNTGLALHKLGVRTRLMGKIGDDLLGRVVSDIVEMQGAGLSSGMVVDPDTSTSYTIILEPPGVDRMFLHSPAANHAFGADTVDYKVVGDARLFHFGYPPLMRRMYADDGAELMEMFRRVKELGVTTSLDMALPDPTTPAGKVDWRNILERVLPYVDVFLPSLVEILFMLRRQAYLELVAEGTESRIWDTGAHGLVSSVGQELLEMGARVVGLKLGDHGFYVRTADRDALAAMGRAAPEDLDGWSATELWIPCFQVEVAGTTGAGDATVAGFLAALLRGRSLEECATMAVAVGACNVEAPDALGGLRDWDETLARVEQGWAQRLFAQRDPAWQWDAVHHLWRREPRDGAS